MGNAAVDAFGCAPAMAFEIELVLAGVVDGFDPLAHARQLAVAAFLVVLAVGGAPAVRPAGRRSSVPTRSRTGPCRRARSSSRSAPMSRACAKSSAAIPLSPSFGSARHHATGIPSAVVIRYSFQPPKPAGVRGAVSVVRPPGQIGTLHRLPGGAARHRGAVDQAEIVGPRRALRGSMPNRLADQRCRSLDPLVVAGLFRQVREQVPESAVRHSQPMMLAAGAEQQLGVGQFPWSSPTSPVRGDHVIVDHHIQFGQEGIEVRRHKRPSMPSSHIRHKPTRRECNYCGIARRVFAASTQSTQSVHTRRGIGNYSSRSAPPRSDALGRPGGRPGSRRRSRPDRAHRPGRCRHG